MRPMASTSRPKMAPASGVPNTDAKPALMPAMISRRRWRCAMLNRWVSWSASAAPICTAVPSRPTEEPNGGDVFKREQEKGRGGTGQHGDDDGQHQPLADIRQQIDLFGES